MGGWIWRLGLRLVFALGLAFAAGPPAQAGCPQGQSANFLGICVPNVGGTVGQIGNEARAQTLGHVLEVWINGSYSTAQSGSRPMPVAMRDQLRGYILESVMNRASYKVGDSGFLNAAFAAQHYGDSFGSEVRATTLVNVIVFRSQADAEDPALWAHELTHVKQFRDWGTHSFAINYARNPSSAEDEAYRVGDNYWAWSNAHRGGAPLPPLLDPPPPPLAAAPSMIPGMPPGPPSSVGLGGLGSLSTVCFVGGGWCPLPAAKLRSTPCSCTGRNGVVAGFAY